ncbi:hypothetical protein J7E97_11010 [Streptomyces sp. ISL-66]|uniref:hypothetical protein n=1 Tax=Streptomyces sp. ISL-66 TaxID=2819186 RepID=UPI001BE6254C|nr:hypothetical protein [Streptomyces sp. ISL-66]MBT2468393.1 hypothetical protein [Streptomyces sp. ISL-66]
MDGATVVYVHGNGNKVRKDLLKAQWDRALFGTDMGVASRMAYWAPVRYGTPLPDDEPDPLAGGPPPVRELPDGRVPRTPDEFIEHTLREARRRAGPALGKRSAQAGEEELAHWLARMTYAAETLGRAEDALPAPAPSDLSEALPLPPFMRAPVFELLVKLTFEDVYAYFFGGVGEAMREVVRGELAGVRDGPLVVLGHSLGSVIAYEVLREERRDVTLLVTAGCPLGITEVQDRLALPTAVPAGVAAWSNVSDLRDLVALDHWLRPEYGPPGLVTDHLDRNASENHHGIAEYLGSATVQQGLRAVFGRVATDRAG